MLECTKYKHIYFNFIVDLVDPYPCKFSFQTFVRDLGTLMKHIVHVWINAGSGLRFKIDIFFFVIC